MAGERETIREMWNEYRRMCIPQDAQPIQIIECRRAFYAGMSAFMCRMRANAMAEMSTADSVSYLDDLTSEQVRFKNSVGTPLEGRE